MEHSVNVNFEDWTGRRAVASLGTNAGSEIIPFQRWRHFKEAFAPEIVHEAVQKSAIAVSSCLDPFGGSGTTALACQFLGVSPTTVEVNPYLADLIEAKLSSYDVDTLATDLARVLEIAEGKGPSPRLAHLPPTFVEPGVKDRWLFGRSCADRILAIADAIDHLERKANRTLFRVLLGGVLVPLSNVIINGKGRRYRRGWEGKQQGAGDVDAAFVEATIAAIGEIRKYGRRQCIDYTLVRGDSRQALTDLGVFDLAVFSPPYPNSFDYTDVYNVELWMLGYLAGGQDNRALRARTMSSHVQLHRSFVAPPVDSPLLNDALSDLESKRTELWSPSIPAMLGAYFSEMQELVVNLSGHLRQGASICAVVGDSRYAGVGFRVAEILSELARAKGLEVTELRVLREMRTSAQQGGREQLSESLLALRKP